MVEPESWPQSKPLTKPILPESESLTECLTKSRNESLNESITEIQPLIQLLDETQSLHSSPKSCRSSSPVFSPSFSPTTPMDADEPRFRPTITAATRTVCTTVWDEQHTLCYHVEVNGVPVARREDNDMINGTKLLNAANLTRGRRDTILKSESYRTVVKSGSAHLRGVWIPLTRAMVLAERFHLFNDLYPLLVTNLVGLLYAHCATTVPELADAMALANFIPGTENYLHAAPVGSPVELDEPSSQPPSPDNRAPPQLVRL